MAAKDNKLALYQHVRLVSNMYEANTANQAYLYTILCAILGPTWW